MPCSESDGRNTVQKSDHVGTAESRASTAFAGFVPTGPTFPTGLEGRREETSKNSTPSSLKNSDGGGAEEGFAPWGETHETTCLTCRHFARPGLADGLCGGGRDDLPPAYGPLHPLRQLPPDRGANCPVWLRDTR